jgi:hypothetical protein
MKKFLKYYIIGFLAGFVITFIALNVAFKEKRVEQKVVVKYKEKIVKVPVKVITPEKINKQKFIQWIYKNSFRCSRKQATEIANLLLKTKYPLLFAAIIKNESSFNITAYSKAGAIGLMQVLPSQDHIKQLKQAKIIKEPRDLFNPSNNIFAGQYIFLDILKINKNNIQNALKMYCGGNSTYVNNVLKTLGELIIYVKGEAE